MAKDYDLSQDEPFGLAQADFPITPYDRPALMMGNLLRGDVDGATRAMLSPSTLSPSQLKTTRDLLLKGKKPNPVIKTILDIATNPLVIIGLGVGLIKFPIGTTAPLLALRKGLVPKAAAMGKLASYSHDAMQNFRTIPGLWESIHKQWKDAVDFSAKQWHKIDDIFVRSGSINKTEEYLVSARLDGLHTTENSLWKLIHNEPEYIAFFGSKNVPIASRLEQTMHPRLRSISDKMRGWYNGIREPILKNKPVRDRVVEAVEAKGTKFGENVKFYHPHHTQYDRYYASSVRGSSGAQYNKKLRKLIKEKVGPEEIARSGEAMADPRHLLALEQAGAIPPGFNNQVLKRILARQSAEASTTARRIWGEVSQAGLNEAAQQEAFISRMTDYYTKGPGKKLNLIGRLGDPKRSADTLSGMADALQTAQFKGAKALEKEFLEIGRVLGEPAKYSLGLFDSANRYINSISQTYSWHGLGNKKAVMKILNTPGIYKNAPHLESLVWDDVLPHVLGFKGWRQMNRSVNWTIRKSKIANWVKNHPVPRSVLGKNGTKWLHDWFSQSPVFASAESMSGTVASNLYVSTLGLNLSSSSKNALQTWITSLNLVGPRGLYYGLNGAAGQEGLLSKLSEYGKRLSEYGMSKAGRAKAFRAAFPEYVADAGNAHKIVESMMAGDIMKEGAVNFAGAKTAWGKVKSFMMMPFATTEAGNRLLSYYAGRNTHLVQNSSKLLGSAAEKAAILKEAGQVGQTLNMISNFPGGPLGMPRALMNLSPATRQFMHFPLRMAGFLHGSLRLGMDAGKRDWGTIGRALAGSTGLYIAGRNLLGVDLSGGLLTGALPLPMYEHAPFYPFPFVPPVVQIPGQLIKSIATGDPRGLGNIAGLLVPGGIAAKRAYQTLSPKYADYENPTPDGRVPLYNQDGALISSMTPMGIVLRGIGLKPTSVTAEQGAAKWLVSQRDRIRKYRREYTMALFENDTGKADKINREFQKVYPEFGPIQIKKSDIRALENRREISRLHRVKKGISRAYKPLFESIINEASLGRVVQDIEMGGLGGLENYSALLQ